MAARRYQELHDPEWLEQMARQHSDAEMAASLGCSVGAVHNARDLWGISRPALRREVFTDHLTLTDAAQVPGRSRSLVREWIRRGQLVAVRCETHGKRPFLIPRSEVERIRACR